MRPFRPFLLATALAAAPALAAPADDFRTLLDEHWAWELKSNPVMATSLGVRTYDDQLGDFSLEEQDRQAAQAGVFLKRLDAIPDAGLSSADRTNKAILHRLLAEQIEANGFGERMMTFSSYSSWFQQFAGLADIVPLRTKADYMSYLTRLALFPKANAQELAITRQGADAGYVQPCVTLTSFEKSITGVIADAPEDSRFYAPFKGPRPHDVTDAEWAAMKARARSLIVQVLNPEYRKIDAYYAGSYLPKCRKSFGASDLPQGRAFYAFQIRQQTTTTYTAERSTRSAKAR